MLSRQAYASILAASIMLILTSYIAVHTLLTYASLAVTTFLAVMALNGLFSLRRINPGMFRVERHVGREFCVVNDVVRVRVKVVNETGRDVYLVARDVVELEVVEGSPHAEGSLNGLEISYAVKASRRGAYRVGPLRLKVYDPFRYALKEYVIESQSYIYVLPPLAARARVVEAVITAGGGRLIGSAENYVTGLDNTYRTLREYRHGEPARNIYWRKSAKTEETPYVKEYDKLSRMKIAFVIDSTPSMLVGDGEELLDDVIAAVLPVARTLLSRGDDVVVRAVGIEKGQPDMIRLGEGRDYTDFVKALIGIRPGIDVNIADEVVKLSRFYDAVVVLSRFAYSSPAELKALTRKLSNKGVFHSLILVRKRQKTRDDEALQVLEEMEERRIAMLRQACPSLVVADSKNLFPILCSVVNTLRKAGVV